MQISIEVVLIAFASIILISVLISKLTEKLGIPVLILFLAIGMVAGSEGIGGVYFDDPVLTQWIATIALAIILFSGGADTEWKSIRPIIKEGIALATIGVVLTAAAFGYFVHLILKLPWMVSFLVGAIASSTDAAAVFSLLRSKGVHLKGKLAPLLEFESGSNDPIAIFLTISVLQFIQNQSFSAGNLFLVFLLQMGVGVIIGWLVARLSLFLINRLKLGYEGLYPVLMIALVFLAFASAALLKGSGYLAVYILGLLMSKHDFLHKRSLIKFFDGGAWLMQIALFVTLGLLVFPSRLTPVILPGVLLSLLLIFIARPLGVFITLIPFKYTLREKVLISWVGLKGAVPIVLATFPLVAGISQADLIFNLVFFIVVLSVLLQGTTLPKVASLLKLSSAFPEPSNIPIEILSGHGIKSTLGEILITQDSPAVGKAIFELGLPKEYLVILIKRNENYIQTNGSTIVTAGDVLLSISEEIAFQQAKALLLPGAISSG